MRTRAIVIAILTLSGATLPGLAAAWEIPAEAYEVIATSLRWGGGAGYLWGHPDQGARMLLDLTGCTCAFGFTIGGLQQKRETPAGTMVTDRWTGPNNGYFVGTYFLEDAADPNVREAADLATSGGGHIGGWEIVVIGHT